MERAIRYTRKILGRVCIGLGVAAGVVGCHKACYTGGLGKGGNCWVDNCSDIPQGAIPLPIGTHVSEFGNRMADKAEADDFVFYYNEWFEDQPVLGPYGTDHLARVLRRMPTVPFMVVIQPEDNPPLNAARRKVIIDALAASGMPDPASRVLVGKPAAEGLFGERTPIIYQGVLQAGGGFGGGGGIGFTGVAGGVGGGFGGIGGFGGFGLAGGGISGFGR